jgi:hypothetical protein
MKKNRVNTNVNYGIKILQIIHETSGKQPFGKLFGLSTACFLGGRGLGNSSDPPKTVPLSFDRQG